MKVIFLGTGEASDNNCKNTSILIHHENDHHLLDCGFSSAHAYLSHDAPNALKSIWISHFHGDHFFGIPQLIVHYYMQKRETPLTIYSGVDPSKRVTAAIDLAYPGLADKLSFPLEFKQLIPGEILHADDLEWQCAPVSHTESAFAVRLQTGDSSLYYSGDGKPTLEAIKLIKKCELVIHEAYSMSPTKLSHSSIEECLLWAGELHIQNLALVHINSQTKKVLTEKKDKLTAPAGTTLILPQDGDSFEL